MEFDRIKKIYKNKNKKEIKKSLKNRLKDPHPKMLEIESIALCILEMMHEKTKQYGGNSDENKTIEYRAWKALFESVERKSKRLETLTINSIKGDKSAQAALIDTYVDLIGGSLFSLQNLIDDFQE